MYGLVVSTNSLKRTHSGCVSRPHEGCNDTTCERKTNKQINRVTRGGVGGATHLVVLDRKITTLLALLVRDLHKISAHERFSDISVVSGLIAIFFGEEVELEALHDS
jgi:hypothetical protein